VKRRGLAANSAFALAADLAGKSSTVAVTAVSARMLPTDRFALLATCLAAAALLTSVLDAGAQTLLTRDGARSADARGSLLRALALGRLPFAAAGLLAAVLVGTALHRPLEAVLTFALSLAYATGMSLTGVLRAAQDLRPEAEWKLVNGVLSVAAVVPAVLYRPTAATVLGALTAAAAISLCLLVPASRSAARFGAAASARRALRSAIPLGLLALATIAYYRSGVLALSLVGSPSDTAAFAIASNVAFGLLAVPNAVTTGLLPRLSAETSETRRVAVARRALAWTLVLSAALVLATATIGPSLLGLVFGARYSAAATPLVLLGVGVLLISASGVLGTLLVCVRRLWPLGAQVGVSLVVNVAALAVLVPPLGASGAALATVACEAAALAFLGAFVWRILPGLVQLPPRLATERP